MQNTASGLTRHARCCNTIATIPAREVSNTYTTHEDVIMTRKSWLRPLIVAFIGISLFGSAYGHNVNRDIDVGDGITTKGQSTVNGSISVGSDAVISGSLDSVNGSIEVGDNSQFRDASVVNGRISLEVTELR